MHRVRGVAFAVFSEARLLTLIHMRVNNLACICKKYSMALPLLVVVEGGRGKTPRKTPRKETSLCPLSVVEKVG